MYHCEFVISNVYFICVYMHVPVSVRCTFICVCVCIFLCIVCARIFLCLFVCIGFLTPSVDKAKNQTCPHSNK